MWNLLVMAWFGSPVAQARDVASALVTLRLDGTWVVVESGPILCPTSPRPLLSLWPEVPDAVVEQARSEPTPLRRAERILAGAEVTDHRFRATPLPGGGVRVSVAEVLGPDCVTWQPFANPLDTPIPVPAGRYTTRELYAALGDGWAASGGSPLTTFQFPAMNVYGDLELDIAGNETLLDVLIVVSQAAVQAGGRDPFWSHVHRGTSRSVTLNVLAPTPPKTPDLPACRPDDPDEGFRRAARECD